MPDPVITTGAAVLEKAVSESPKVGGSSDFEKILASKLEVQSEMTQKLIDSLGMSPGKKPFESASAEGLSVPSNGIVQQETGTNNRKVFDLLADVNRSALQMEDIMEMTTSGRRFSPPELLAMQAGVHQIALEIDLTGKVIEQLNAGTKQLLNTSFQ